MPGPLSPPLARIRAHLAHGGLIAYATESCFGLGCDPRSARAVLALLRLKGRPRHKGLILVAHSFARLAPFVCAPSERARAVMTTVWPGPTTVLLPSARHTPRWLTGRHETLAVRVSAHPDTAHLARALGQALVSTSANPAGHKPARTAAGVRRMFGGQVLVVRGRIGRRTRPSTILDPETGRIIRP
ncbi:MAG: Sua5/YciO/YrdC/YwlC family protein [Betaproteobacteria bacterium]|nr:Sua5/YciO/YrdC/YwlC family protein [Betaproteobacteria bacterium]